MDITGFTRGGADLRADSRSTPSGAPHSRRQQGDQRSNQLLFWGDLGCGKVFHDRVSTRVTDKDRAMLHGLPGRTAGRRGQVIAKLDRPGHTQVELIVRLKEL